MQNERKLTFPHQIHKIESKITKLSKFLECPVVFEATFISIQKALTFFLNEIKLKTFPIRPATQNEIQNVKEILKLLSDLQSLSADFNSENYKETISLNPIQNTLNFFRGFGEKFNSLIASLHVSDHVPFVTSYYQLNKNEMIKLSETIKEIVKCNVDVTKKEAVEQRLEEITKITNFCISYEQNQKESDEKLRHILTQSEIEETLASFSFWFVKYSDFIIDKKIGAGAFSKVYKGKQKSTDRIVAIKKINSNKFNLQDFEIFNNEIEILSSLHHFSIISFVGVCISPSFLIITDYYSGGNLYNWLRQSPNKNDPTKLTIIALGVACGLSYMHSQKLIHRDIKSTNILLDENDFPKICDFGVSQYLDFDGNNDKNNNNFLFGGGGGVGTSRWMAPEVLDFHPYDEKADVYSYGILLWEMITHDIPWKGVDDFQIINDVLHKDERPKIPKDCASEQLSKLIKKCWSKDPEQRPDFQSIARSLASGEIEFFNTKHEFVDIYMNKSVQTSSQDPIGDLSIEQIMKDLKCDPLIGLSKIKTAFTKNRKIIDNNNLIDELRKIAKSCKSHQMASEIIQILAIVFSDEQNTKYFAENDGDDAVYKLITNYSIPSMAHVVEVFGKIHKISPLKNVTEKQLEKITSFLIAGDMEAVLILKEMITMNSVQNVKYIYPLIFQSFSNKTCADVLLPILEVIEYISSTEMSENYFNDNLLDFILSILEEGKCEEIVIKIILNILEQSMPSESFVNRFFSLFSTLVTSNNEIGALAILSLCVRWKISFNIEDIFDPLIECLHSKSTKVLICSLKLLFALSFKIEQFSLFSPFFEEIPTLLNSSDENVSMLASALLIVLIQNNYEFDISNFIHYLSSNLETSSDESKAMMALRLCGVLTGSIDNIIFLDKKGIFDSVADYLSSQNEMLGKLSLICFTSASYMYPFSKALVRCTGKIIKFLRDSSENSKYSQAFVANVSACADGAIECQKYIHDIISLLYNCDSDTEFRILTCIARTSQSNEALSQFDSNFISNIIELTRDKWESCNNELIFEIYRNIVSLESGKSALQNINFDRFCRSKLAALCSHQQRTLIIQIYSRI